MSISPETPGPTLDSTPSLAHRVQQCSQLASPAQLVGDRDRDSFLGRGLEGWGWGGTTDIPRSACDGVGGSQGLQLRATGTEAQRHMRGQWGPLACWTGDLRAASGWSG
jgi:hypothetical protein